MGKDNSKWERISIIGICDILDNKRKPISSQNRIKGDFPYYGANGIQDYVNDYIFDDELVLLAEDGGNFGSKEKPIAYRVSGKCWINNHAHVLKPKENLDVDFLCYSLMFYDVSDLINGATRSKLNKSALSKILIPFPPLETQQRIANILDKANELIEKRKLQIEKLDELIKSKFIDMFGDPVNNPMGWTKKPIGEIMDYLVPGRNKPKNFTGKIPWITIDDLIINGITFISKKTLGLTQFEINEVKRKTIPKNSVIMSCVGNLGLCSLSGQEMIINQQLHAFLPNKSYSEFYILYALTFQKDYMIKHANSTVVLYMNKRTCNSIPICCVPITLQTKFATFVEKVESQKELLQNSLKQLEENYKSLMQKCFNGELFE